MKTFHGAASSPPALRRPKVTLGTFDGVHRGHQRVLRELVTWARATESDAVVVTFDHKPRRVLSGRNAGEILSLPHRLLLFDRLGVDATLVLKFDRALAAMEPEAFVGEILLDRLQAAGVLLGHDTRFGRAARGDADLLMRLGRQWAFEVCAVPVVELDGQPVSSTRLRDALRAGDLRLAEQLMGRRVSLYGTVVGGTHRGSGIGYPTANLNLHHEIHPPPGVYATRTHIDGLWHDSVTNIGRPPALKPEGPEHLSEKFVVESHVLDYAGDLYGKDIEVQFIERVRAEEVFHSPGALAARIAQDIEEARRVLLRRRWEAETEDK